MTEDEFADLADAAFRALPPTLRERIHNVSIAIQRKPSARLLRELGMEDDETLLGLYEGIPLTERTHDGIGSEPDMITLFLEPIIEASDGTPASIQREIEITLYHEIAHYFGLSDDRLDELGAY
ncbi:metallopeptidase family protein [Chrysiogenes arsenatis]|uniref:metallopeptidase family protein n=1 Tax=Chrysiogenes arsenatis TaxID=309797 RepID=UPI000419BF6C|nr:metallopeptidase family protein [Chrysiogenes arsenatis]